MSNTTTSPTPWESAVELLLSQLILVLEAEGSAGFSGEKLERWVQACSSRMEQTNSVPPATIAALRGLCGRVTA